MKKRNYIFTNKKHANKAVMSVILGIISNVSLVIVVYLTYLRQGDAKNGYGVTGFLACIYSLVGLVLALITVQDKNNFRLFPILGIIFNGIALTGIGIMLYMGMKL